MECPRFLPARQNIILQLPVLNFKYKQCYLEVQPYSWNKTLKFSKQSRGSYSTPEASIRFTVKTLIGITNISSPIPDNKTVWASVYHAVYGLESDTI